MERDLAKDLKVGVFVIVVLGMGLFSAYLLGGQSEIFQSHYALHCKFPDVAGLRGGAVIRLAGIDVGEVKSINFDPDPANREILVELSVISLYGERIREDSIARIETEGMLGDKYISITPGSLDGEDDDGDGQIDEVLPPGAWIPVETATSMLEYQAQASRVLNDVEAITEKINLALGTGEDADEASLSRIVTQVEQILGDAQDGRGLLHALIYDEALADSVARSSRNIETFSASVADVGREIQTGEGIAHEMIYGVEGAKLAQQLGGLAEVLEQLVGDLEDEEGLVHALIYDTERAAMVEDLHASAAAMREVAEAINDGEGTVGMLANDPELYEDLRALVNGAQRNKLLRAYIRRTVEEGEAEHAEAWTTSGGDGAASDAAP